MSRSARWTGFLLVLVGGPFLLSACHRELVATPNLLVGEGARAYAATPGRFCTPEMRVLYFTDREVERESEVGPVYGSGRSRSMAFGTATVVCSPEPSWEELLSESTSAEREKDYALEIRSVVEEERMPFVRDMVEIRDGRIRYRPEMLARVVDARTRFWEMVARWSEGGEPVDVIVFVHGFNNEFDDAVFRTAELWHFMGRTSVPVAFTWPAGSGSFLRGYNYDRESGEFTVPHLKALLRALADCPHVGRIHLISHSRGTDVATTAIREIFLEYVGRGLDAQREMKLSTLVLAASDLDFDVANERFFVERVVEAAGKVVVYVSDTDKALGLSTYLFRSDRRLGSVRVEDLSEQAKERLAAYPRLEVIDCDVSGYSTSHNYAFAHPAVLSDLIRVIRDGAQPGAENGRPLESPEPGIWRIRNDYLKKE